MNQLLCRLNNKRLIISQFRLLQIQPNYCRSCGTCKNVGKPNVCATRPNICGHDSPKKKKAGPLLICTLGLLKILVASGITIATIKLGVWDGRSDTSKLVHTINNLTLDDAKLLLYDGYIKASNYTYDQAKTDIDNYYNYLLTAFFGNPYSNNTNPQNYSDSKNNSGADVPKSKSKKNCLGRWSNK